MKLTEFVSQPISMAITTPLYLTCNTVIARAIESNYNSEQNKKIRFFELTDGNSYVSATILTDPDYYSGLVTSQSISEIEVCDRANITLRLSESEPDSGNV